MDLIDATWIKNHLTHRHGELKALADAAGLAPDKITKILKGERQIKANEAPRIAAFFQASAPGFAEAASTFQSHAVPIAATGGIMTLAVALCPNLRQPEFYRVKQSFPVAGLLSGDLLVVDLRTTPQAGELVLVTISDTDADTHLTLVRQFWPPLVVPLSPDDPYPATLAEGTQTTAILATVKAVARGGMLD